jgi:hypothetical protein
MKKRVITGAAALLGTAMTMGSCGLYGPPQATNPAVYGPPEYFESETSETADETFKAEDTLTPTLYGPPEYSESNEKIVSLTEVSAEIILTEPECIYGPPEWFETEDTTTEPEVTTSEENTASATNTTTTTTTTTSATSEDTEETEDEPTFIDRFINDLFDPEENDPVEVYGPPEWFE